jgi:hypothetical protein
MFPTNRAKYAITGPGWSGTLPPGVTEYKSPTGLVWLLGRIYCVGTPADYAAVHALQDKFSLVPLSSYGKPYTPVPGMVDSSFDMKTAVRDQVDALSVNDYFNYLASAVDEDQPAGGRRCPDGRQDEGHWVGARQVLRSQQAWRIRSGNH